MNTNKIDTPTLILIVILMMGLINGMIACTSSRVVYQKNENSFGSMSKKSSVTGWNYSTYKTK